MQTTIRIQIDNSAMTALDADYQRLLKTLRQLEAGSPWTFQIVGVSEARTRAKIPSSIADKAYRDLIDQMLTDANYRTNPKAYSGKILGGHPLAQRIKAAEPAARTMRERAIKDYLDSQQPIRGATTRNQAKVAYDVARAIFGNNILRNR